MISAQYPWLSPLAAGFGLGASLIVAIGSQNAFVLRQGLKAQHVLAVCTICFLCDALLISLGAGGFSSMVSASPLLMRLTLWGGVLFLTVYGARSFVAAIRPGTLVADADTEEKAPFARIVVTTLSLSLLNPHAFLDTVVLLGSLASHYAGHARLLFAVGAIFASFAWFFTLGFGARGLAPLFRTPSAWRVLDILVACTMWGIAAKLAWPA